MIEVNTVREALVSAVYQLQGIDDLLSAIQPKGEVAEKAISKLGVRLAELHETLESALTLADE